MQIGKKSSSLEPGYVYAPYIPMTTTSVISESSKNVNRKRKINKIFDLGLEISCETFSPNVKSRYAAKVVNSKYYQTVKIK